MRFCSMKYTYNRSLLSIAIAALMLVSLCAADFCPLSVSAVDGSNTNVQATNFVTGQLASGTGPAVCSQDANSLDVFVQGTDHVLYYTHWDGTTWSVPCTKTSRLFASCEHTAGPVPEASWPVTKLVAW